VALKKSEKRLLIILGIAVVSFLFNRFVLSKGQENNVIQQNVQNITQTQVKSNTLLADVVSPNPVGANIELPMEYFESWGRDPFFLNDTRLVASGSSPVSKKESKPKPVLKGIFWKANKPYVLLDDHILSEGEEVEGTRVEKINGSEVLCSQGSQSFTLYWRESP